MSGIDSGDNAWPLSSSIPVERRLIRRFRANSAGVVELMVMVTVGGVSVPVVLAFSSVLVFSVSDLPLGFGGNLIVQQVVSFSTFGELVALLSTESILFTFCIIELKSFSESDEFLPVIRKMWLD